MPPPTPRRLGRQPWPPPLRIGLLPLVQRAAAGGQILPAPEQGRAVRHAHEGNRRSARRSARPTCWSPCSTTCCNWTSWVLPRGEARHLISGGAIELGGVLPVNPHGGQLGEACIYGMNGIAEAVRQIRGTAVNQISGAGSAGHGRHRGRAQTKENEVAVGDIVPVPRGAVRGDSRIGVP